MSCPLSLIEENLGLLPLVSLVSPSCVICFDVFEDDFCLDSCSPLVDPAQLPRHVLFPNTCTGSFLGKVLRFPRPLLPLVLSSFL